jgi:hypothetical protein
MFRAFLESAARQAAKISGVIVDEVLLKFAPSIWALERQNTTLMIVRQSILCLWIVAYGAVAGFAAEPFAVQKAKQELDRVKELAAIGAVSKARLLQAEEKLSDARDEDTLGRLLYGRVGVEELSEAQTKELVDAAQRRVDRVAKQYLGQTGLVEQGVIPKGQVDEIERQLADRRMALQLAEGRAKIFDDLLNMAKLEELSFQDEHDEDVEPKPVVEKYVGSGVFKDAHLKYVEAAFEKQFGKPLPVSARGQSSLHTMLGFDHAGRVDVGVNPDDAEGQWLRQQLEALRVPYIALRAMIPGKSTAPHIHIGLPSLRLKQADTASGGGLN